MGTSLTFSFWACLLAKIGMGLMVSFTSEKKIRIFIYIYIYRERERERERERGREDCPT